MTRRRSSAPRRWAIGASALVALVFAGVAIANAAGLTVTSRQLFAQNAARCTNATIATTGFRNSGTGNWNRVRLVGVPAACAGLPVSVVVYRSSGSSFATGTGTAAEGAVDITTTAYASGNATGVALLIGGWGVPTTWDTGGKVISLQSFQNTDYVTVDGTTSQLIANGTTAGTPQKFSLKVDPDGTIGLQSLLNSMNVCADLNIATPPPLMANRTWILQWEEFYLIID